MEIVKTIPPKKTKEKKYMFVCKTCQREENGFNYGKTTFVADYPKDFSVSLTSQECCKCPACGTLHYRNRIAELRYLWYSHRNGDKN